MFRRFFGEKWFVYCFYFCQLLICILRSKGWPLSQDYNIPSTKRSLLFWWSLRNVPCLRGIAFCLSPSSSLFLVLWCLHLRGFILVLITVLCPPWNWSIAVVFFEVCCVWNVLLHAVFRTSWNSSMCFSMSVSDVRIRLGGYLVKSCSSVFVSGDIGEIWQRRHI